MQINNNYYYYNNYYNLWTFCRRLIDAMESTFVQVNNKQINKTTHNYAT